MTPPHSASERELVLKRYEMAMRPAGPGPTGQRVVDCFESPEGSWIRHAPAWQMLVLLARLAYSADLRDMTGEEEAAALDLRDRILSAASPTKGSE